MDRRNEIGFQLHRLSTLVKRMVDQTVFPEKESEKRPTGMHGWIIGYLYANRNREVYQRDIQEEFSVRRSTVTGMLQLMERNGLITRHPVPEDARLKRILLTPLAIKQHEKIMAGFQQVEKRIASGLTEEEKATFLKLCEKIAANLE